MNIEPLSLKGAALLIPRVFADDRGFFTERFRTDVWSQFLPGHPGFIQENYSWSAPRVLRGMHYQFGPDQGKLVTCMSGSILDVIVDIRGDSPTRGQHVKVELESKKPMWLWVPAGFAHGFYVTSQEGAGVLYKVDAPYSPKSEGAIAWNDPDLNIEWPDRSPICSGKDQAAESYTSFIRKPF